MPFTNAWDETAPAGSSLRSTIDDATRTLKFDIRERMNTILSPTTPWDGTVNPLLIIAPKRKDVVKLIPCFALQPEEDDDDIEYNDGYAQSDNSGNNAMRMGLPTESAWEIKKVEVLFNLDSDTQCTITLYKTAFSGSPTNTAIDNVVVGTTGIGIQEVFSGVQATDDASYYWLLFRGNDAGRWRAYSVRITYDEV